MILTYFLPNVIDDHTGSTYIANLFSSKFEQWYNSVGFDEGNMKLLKRRIDNIVIKMCMHENDDNNDGYSYHQKRGIDIDYLKKCVNYM